MHPILVLIVFILQGKAIGAQLVGSADTVQGCEQLAGQVIHDKSGQEPSGPEGQAAPFPACVDTRPMVETLATGPKQST